MTSAEPLMARNSTDETANGYGVAGGGSVDGPGGLGPLLAPRTVVVVGAGGRHDAVGHETVRALRDYGFRGHLYAVNRSGRPVCGVPAYRGIEDLPEPVDLMLLAVPPDQTADLLTAAGRRGTRTAMLLSTATGRGVPESAWPDAELLRIAARHGIRLAGPDSLGVINTNPKVRLNASLARVRPMPGGLAMAVRSATVGMALLDEAVRSGCGLASFVSLGEASPIGPADLVDQWRDDSTVRAVALHMESSTHRRPVAPTARAAGRRKPVLALGSIPPVAGPSVPATAVSELRRQTGIVQATSIADLLAAARMLVDQPPPAGSRLGIVGNAGSLTGLCGQIATDHGLTVASLSPEVRRQLPSVAGAARRDNPVDLGVAARPAEIARAVETVAASGEVDALLLMIVGTRANVPAAILDAVGRVVDDHPRLPFAAVLIGGAEDLPRLGTRAVPVYAQVEQAVPAVAHACAYGRWRAEPSGLAPVLGGVHVERARTAIRHALTQDAGWLPYHRTVEILAAYGIMIRPAGATRSELTAQRLGHAVTITISGPSLVNTGSARGAGLSPFGARTTQESFEAVSAVAHRDAMVQPSSSTPVELAARVVRDPFFGPILLLGLGGARAGRSGGPAARLVPLTDLDAGRLWRASPAAPLLSGAEGGDTAVLEDLLVRLSRLAEDQPEVTELDLSAVFAGRDGLFATHARLRLASPGQPGTTGGAAQRP